MIYWPMDYSYERSVQVVASWFLDFFRYTEVYWEMIKYVENNPIS